MKKRVLLYLDYWVTGKVNILISKNAKNYSFIIPDEEKVGISIIEETSRIKEHQEQIRNLLNDEEVWVWHLTNKKKQLLDSLDVNATYIDVGVETNRLLRRRRPIGLVQMYKKLYRHSSQVFSNPSKIILLDLMIQEIDLDKTQQYTRPPNLTLEYLLEEQIDPKDLVRVPLKEYLHRKLIKPQEVPEDVYENLRGKLLHYLPECKILIQGEGNDLKNPFTVTPSTGRGVRDVHELKRAVEGKKSIVLKNFRINVDEFIRTKQLPRIINSNILEILQEGRGQSQIYLAVETDEISEINMEEKSYISFRVNVIKSKESIDHILAWYDGHKAESVTFSIPLEEIEEDNVSNTIRISPLFLEAIKNIFGNKEILIWGRDRITENYLYQISNKVPILVEEKVKQFCGTRKRISIAMSMEKIFRMNSISNITPLTEVMHIHKIAGTI